MQEVALFALPHFGGGSSESKSEKADNSSEGAGKHLTGKPSLGFHSDSKQPMGDQPIFSPTITEDIKCICSYQHDDGFTISCETCEEWQHGVCMAINPDHIPNVYECSVCNPGGAQHLEIEIAVNVQKNFLRSYQRKRRRELEERERVERERVERERVERERVERERVERERVERERVEREKVERERVERERKEKEEKERQEKEKKMKRRSAFDRVTIKAHEEWLIAVHAGFNSRALSTWKGSRTCNVLDSPQIRIHTDKLTLPYHSLRYFRSRAYKSTAST